MTLSDIITAEHQIIEEHGDPDVSPLAVAKHLGVDAYEVLSVYASTSSEDMADAITSCVLCEFS